MESSTLVPALKNLSFNTELLPQLRYPLPTIALTEMDFAEILKPAMAEIKHGLGIAKTSQTEVVFFPKQYEGFGISDLYIDMLSEQAKYVIQHTRNKDSLGRRIKISIEVSQMEAGTNKDIEEFMSRKEWGCITPTIPMNLYKGLQKYGARIHIQHWAPTRGATIMEAVLCGNVTSRQSEIVNRCRMWLRVHYLADVGTVDGRMIHPGYIKGERIRQSKWRWPTWEPPQEWWSTWTAIMESIISQMFPIIPIWERHQIPQVTMNREGNYVTMANKTYKVTGRHRVKTMESTDVIIHTDIPCDVQIRGTGKYLLPTVHRSLETYDNKTTQGGVSRTLSERGTQLLVCIRTPSNIGGGYSSNIKPHQGRRTSNRQ